MPASLQWLLLPGQVQRRLLQSLLPSLTGIPAPGWPFGVLSQGPRASEGWLCRDGDQLIHFPEALWQKSLPAQKEVEALRGVGCRADQSKSRHHSQGWGWGLGKHQQRGVGNQRTKSLSTCLGCWDRPEEPNKGCPRPP